MRKIFILLFLLPYISQGQDIISTSSKNDSLLTAVDTSKHQPVILKTYLRKDVWRIDFLGPGYINEHRLGKKTTVVSQLRLVGSFRIEDRLDMYGYSLTVKKVLALSINPELALAIRHFYNLARRKENGKSIRYNSGSYFAAKAGYVLPPILNNSNIDIQGLGVSGLWGVQQTYRKYFYLNLEVGVGVAQYYEHTISPTGNFLLGYTF
ncbi:hypothetical protein EXU85_18665 [Spirosoma sp. KCTC 42546]|uniref:hypothetical protein n=1 Tax=Spirosoma sp. KCTC 42546 TaxID=2520506 RepID=UPI00115A45D6|nr:hypothetical protein [Spirosoma sp. KCTC 42546]QDK80517.1 hypothetical protein EXU85_18665 [Spirosoma sp. KCTC 42546]